MSLTDSFIQNSILPPHRFSRNTQIYLSQKQKKTPSLIRIIRLAVYIHHTSEDLQSLLIIILDGQAAGTLIKTHPGFLAALKKPGPEDSLYQTTIP